MKNIEALTDHKKIDISMALFSRGDLSLEQWDEFTQHKYSKNSLLGFKNDWQYFVDFCQKSDLSSLPAKVTTVKKFIAESAKTRKISSLKRYVITIGNIHRLHQQSDPTKHRELRYFFNKYYLEKSDETSQAQAFTLYHLNALIEKLNHSENLKDLRDLLIWTLSFDAMLKRSELANIKIEDLAKEQGIFQLQIREHLIPLSEFSSDLISHWLAESQISQGYLLRRINKHGHLGELPLDHSSIYRVFRRAATLLELTELSFSGQSARVGASQELAKMGKSLKEIQYQGRWKSPAMPAQYLGDRQTRDHAMAKYKKKILKD